MTTEKTESNVTNKEISLTGEELIERHRDIVDKHIDLGRSVYIPIYRAASRVVPIPATIVKEKSDSQEFDRYEVWLHQGGIIIGVVETGEGPLYVGLEEFTDECPSGCGGL